MGRGNFGGTWIGQVFVGRAVLLDLVKFCWVWSSFVGCGQVLVGRGSLVGQVLLDVVKCCLVWSSFVGCDQVLVGKGSFGWSRFVRCGQIHLYIVLQTQIFFIDDVIPFQTTLQIFKQFSPWKCCK